MRALMKRCGNSAIVKKGYRFREEIRRDKAHLAGTASFLQRAAYRQGVHGAHVQSRKRRLPVQYLHAFLEHLGLVFVTFNDVGDSPTRAVPQKDLIEAADLLRMVLSRQHAGENGDSRSGRDKTGQEFTRKHAVHPWFDTNGAGAPAQRVITRHTNDANVPFLFGLIDERRQFGLVAWCHDQRPDVGLDKTRDNGGFVRAQCIQRFILDVDSQPAVLFCLLEKAISQLIIEEVDFPGYADAHLDSRKSGR